MISVNMKVFIFMTLLISVTSQAQNGCTVKPSQSMPDYKDIYCKCDTESLQDGPGQINNIFLDRTDCGREFSINISWSGLETWRSFHSISFIGFDVILMPPVTKAWNSTVRKINFINCDLRIMSSRGFEGLTQLEEIRFEQSHLFNISSYAISNLQNLKILDFLDSTVNHVEAHAISGLPNLEQLGFIRCSIEELATNAIHILRTPDLPITSDCPNVEIRTNNNNRDERVMKTVMERRLASSDEIPLPEIGARLIFYKSNISIIGNSGIESNIFSYLVIAGSTFTYLKERAFNVELSNQCEISLLEIIQNNFENLQTDSFAYVSGKQKASHKTYFLMINNTFDKVAINGFRFHPTLEAYMINDNKFNCACPKFQWHFFSVLTATSNVPNRQQSTEEKLLSSSTCLKDGSKLENFLVNCSGDETTAHSIIPAEHEHTTRKNVLAGNRSALNGANHFIVVVAVFCIVLLKNILLMK